MDAPSKAESTASTISITEARDKEEDTFELESPSSAIEDKEETILDPGSPISSAAATDIKFEELKADTLKLELTTSATSTTDLKEKVAAPDEEQNRPKSQIMDTGFDAWSTVAGSWFMMFATLGYLYSFGVYQDFYTRELLANYLPSKIAWIGSLQLAMPFALGIVSGKLFDKGYFRILIASGSVIFAVSLFMLSLIQPHRYYQVFLAQGVGMGIGLGLTFVPSLSILVMHFDRRKSLASGIALSGSSIGAVVFPISSITPSAR
ncbi:hypothetical protein H0H93_010537 [Arthromyces matolae]|nr:hypothetical protein H0H93_010537 [Arthromyces matolae]